MARTKRGRTLEFKDVGSQSGPTQALRHEIGL